MTLLLEKRCGLCGEVKPASDFHRHPKARDGLQKRCKPCACAAARMHYAKNRDHELALGKAWRVANQGKYDALRRRSKLKTYYNLTPEDYERMLEAQGGCCAICRGVEPGRGCRDFCVDHDHRCCPGLRSCGRCVRGLLCKQCNDGLGRFDDQQELLMAAIRYLGGET